MIKKLDILIIRSFVGPFLATFLISLFVLIMQFFWLYIDDLVGKGLDIKTLGYLTGVVAITWVPLALPLSLLLSSIMTFGNLGETFEIVAIKSAGIPLLRFMRPLVIVTCFISGIAFLFANNIIPVAQLKFESLKHDIIIKKPAFDIKEGVFYNKIEGFVIKIGQKEKNDSIIHNIVIYEKGNTVQDNLILAESGVMRVSSDSRFLEFILKNGHRYEEKGQRFTFSNDFIRLGFKEYKKVFDLSSFTMNKSQEDAFKYDPKMLSMRQLNKAIDSLNRMDEYFINRTRTEVNPYLRFTEFADTMHKVNNTPLPPTSASLTADKTLKESLKKEFYLRSLNQLKTVSNNISLLEAEYKTRKESLRKHQIEWNRKLTLSAACMVLFLIGAPLGAIIRKGGLGTPLVFAIAFFVVFHLLNTFGEKFAKEGVVSPFVGMWFSTGILIPVGIFLTYKAMQDSQLFNQEVYFRFFSKLKILLSTFIGSLKTNKDK